MRTPWFVVQLRHCFSGKSDAGLQGSSLIHPWLAWHAPPRDPISKEGHAHIWAESSLEGDTRALVTAATAESPSVFRASGGASQTPRLSPAPSPLKARGRHTFCLKMQHQPSCHPRLQLSGVWHAYKITQPETSLAILRNCKWFSQEGMHLSLPVGRKSVTTNPRSKGAVHLTVCLYHTSLRKGKGGCGRLCCLLCQVRARILQCTGGTLLRAGRMS